MGLHWPLGAGLGSVELGSMVGLLSLVRERGPWGHWDASTDPEGSSQMGTFSERKLDYKVKGQPGRKRENQSKKGMESLGVLAEEIRDGSLGGNTSVL